MHQEQTSFKATDRPLLPLIHRPLSSFDLLTSNIHTHIYIYIYIYIYIIYIYPELHTVGTEGNKTPK